MISYIEKLIGLVVFWKEIASFMMSLKDRWRKWKEYEEEEEEEEEEHSSLMICETEDIAS